ncbi:deubiquitinase OTU2 [Aspergillus saccharolyticus JOP 1030-1]|uniref:Putative OTU-like cysteine protease n=1 Tax=Aspergillus saccharolyticus JOP 1030-1 TaxID=1450539 RepID=A0A318ZS63_9EURO|nr:putative OTU-like cysteine protease [Aspergillus saccharolyticus JOP 1030-1]PYH46790.1 putative OTU-like cysteine protease [Aspergillus saccharolyticus JOP 1030-1]
MDELLAKHRKEQKDLQAKITQKKKSATKKTRKGINDECDRLQRELTDRQQAQIAELNGESVNGIEDLSISNEKSDDESTSKDEVNDFLDNSSTTMTVTPSPPSSGSSTTTATPEPSGPRPKKPNRQKARLARRAAEQAAQSAIAAEEAANQTDHRGNEKEVMDAVFKRLQLKEIEINPDGHCLYSAIASQLDEMGLGLKPDPKRMVLQAPTQSRVDTVTFPKHDGYRAVRAVAADFIVEHKDDFEAFMEEPLDQYARKIKLTAEWGGQLELQALARAYGVEINVIQGDGRIEKIEPGETDGLDDHEKSRRVIWLAYYRHTYGLGEHYNALSKQS